MHGKSDVITKILESDEGIRKELSAVAGAMEEVMDIDRQWRSLWNKTGSYTRTLWYFGATFLPGGGKAKKLKDLERRCGDLQTGIAKSIAKIDDHVGEILLAISLVEGRGGSPFLKPDDRRGLRIFAEAYRQFMLSVDCQIKYRKTVPDKTDLAGHYQLINKIPSNFIDLNWLVSLGNNEKQARPESGSVSQ